MKRRCAQLIAATTATVALSLLLVSCAGNPQKAKLEYLQKGDGYMTQKQYSSAAIEYRNALKLDPHYSDAYYHLGKAYLALFQDDSLHKPGAAQQDLQGAYKAFSSAVSSDPNQLDARVALAELIMSAHAQKQYYAATDDMNYVLKQDPKNAEAHRVLGALLLAQKQYDQAIQEFSKAAALAPSNPDAYIGIAATNIAMHRGDNPDDRHLDDAESNLKKAVEVDPHAVQAYLRLADLYVQEKKPDQAEETVQASINVNPSVVGLYDELSKFYLGQNSPSKAEQVLQSGIKANPSATQLYEDLAQFYFAQKNPAQAEQVLETGIKASPSAVPLYLGLAQLYETERKQQDAENILTNLSNQMPNSADAAIAIGDFYRGAKMNDRALAEYQRGLSANPKSANIEEDIIDLYLTEGQTDLATKLDAELLKHSPDDVIGLVDHGRVLMAQGKPTEAINALQKITTEAPNSPEAHYYLAVAYLQNHDSAQANSELQQTLAQANSERQRTGHPSSYLSNALTALVNLNSAQGNFSVAQLYAQEFIKDNPTNPAGHLMLGEALLNLKQLKQAGDEFATAQKLAPDNPAVSMDLGLLYNAEGNPSEAEKQLQAAMREAPTNSAIVAEYAQLLTSEKQLPKASAVVTQFLAQNPNQAAAHYLMGEIDQLEKNDSAALAETQKCIQLDPKNEQAYIQLGSLYNELGSKDAAIQAYQQGMAAGSPSAPIATAIGSIYMQEGDLSKASAEFQQALTIDPNFFIAANNLAWIYAEQGQNLDVALGLAQRAKAQRPDVPSFSDTLAWVMFRKGDYAGAIPLLKDCVAKDPSSAQFLYHLGMVLVADGQKSEGKAKLQAALQKNLDTQDAEQARKTLSQ